MIVVVLLEASASVYSVMYRLYNAITSVQSSLSTLVALSAPYHHILSHQDRAQLETRELYQH